MNGFRVYCGPTLVHALAARLSSAGVEVTCTGTAHVYVATYYTLYELLKVLNTVSSGFTPRDVLFLKHVDAVFSC